MACVAYGQGRIQGDRMRGMHASKAIFKNVFDEYNFSIISNFCDSCKPYTPEARIITVKMCEQNASYLAKLSKLGSKSLNKTCLKLVQKALK